MVSPGLAALGMPGPDPGAPATGGATFCLELQATERSRAAATAIRRMDGALEDVEYHSKPAGQGAQAGAPQV